MTENVKHVEAALGCFEAAEIEGWSVALQDGDIERIRDLWQRRICYAIPVLETVLDKLQREAAGGGEGFEAWFAKQDSRTEWRELVRLAYTAPRPTGTDAIAHKGPSDFAAHVCPAESAAVWNACCMEHEQIKKGLAPILKTTLTTPASAEPCYCRRCHPTLGDTNATPPKAAPCQPTEARGGGEAELQIGATRSYGNFDWFREFKIGDVTLLAELDKQDEARHLLGRLLSHPTPAALDAEDGVTDAMVWRACNALHGSTRIANLIEDADSFAVMRTALIAARATTGARHA